MTRSGMRSASSFIAWCGVAALLACGVALADPPGRVARLSQIAGAVSFSPAGEEDWVLAQTNRPLVSGDRVWADTGSRAELQIGTASARMGSTTSVALLNLDDRIAQINLAQGTLNLRVRRIYPEQVFEIDTPNLAFTVKRAGDYRVDVDPAGNATIIRVRGGQGDAWGEGVAYTIDAGQQYTFAGEGLRDYSFDPMPAADEFDSWCFERNRREDAAVAARYVSPDIVGYSDLDDYGAWRAVDGYGNVWFPTAVAADWVPYRQGHWAWVDPWGWTWIDDAPWGFAPFHYGRWAYVSTRWCWVPGPIAVRPVYAPALVAFVGGGGFRLSISTGPVEGIAWFPLGPGEVYRPAYAVSQNYFTSVNVSNTVVNTTVINNVYNNVNVTNIVYRNREAPGAVTAVSTAAFSSAQPVARSVLPISRDVLAREPVSPVAAVAPSHASVLAVGAAAAGAAAIAAARRPPAAVLARPVVAKTPPPPPPSPFANRASLLAAQPGKPLEPEKLRAIQPARTAETAKIKVVAPTLTPQPPSKQGAGTRAERAATPALVPPGATQPNPAQERAMKENKVAPGGAVPQPPPAPERAMKEDKVPPAGAGVPQPPPQRAMKENKVPPAEAGVPQPPPQRAMKENKVPPAEAGAPQPPPQRAMKENKASPAGAGVPQPPPERAMRENKAPPPSAVVPQPPPQRAVKENKPPPPAAAVSQPPPPPQRVLKESKAPVQGAGSPPPQPPPEVHQNKGPPSPQERAQKAPPPPPSPPQAPPAQTKAKPKAEEDKAKEKEKAQ